MVIKKHKNKNNYYLHNNLFIRDLTKDLSTPIDINNFYTDKDYSILLDNENNNLYKRYPYWENSFINYDKAIIVSDGLDFNIMHHKLSVIQKNVCIFAVNGALKKWQLVGKNCPDDKKRSIEFYVANNPYEECCWFLPKEHSYYPRMIASTRTNSIFMNRYLGLKYLYVPANIGTYSGSSYIGINRIDDYRNPICACLSICYFSNIKQITILFCDDSFKTKKPGSIQLENDLFCYPQQITSSELVDGMCYWLSKVGIKIFYNSSGPKMKYAEYINLEDVIK